MNAIRKHFNRSAQTIKRNIVPSGKRTDPDYDLLVKTINDQIKSLRLMNTHITQWLKMCSSQIVHLKVLAQDTRTVYSDPTQKKKTKKVTSSSEEGGESSPEDLLCQPRELKMAQMIQSIAEKQEQDVLKPFTEKCTEIQAEIKQYLNDVKAMSRSNSLKVRHRRLLDYEMYEDRWNTVSARPRKTTKEMAIHDDAKVLYMNAKEAFEEADNQAKREMREVILQRYNRLHSLLVKLYSEAMADYYDLMSTSARAFRQIGSVEPLDPLSHELQQDAHSASLAYYTIGGFAHYLPPPVMPSSQSSRSTIDVPEVSMSSDQTPYPIDDQSFGSSLPYPAPVDSRSDSNRSSVSSSDPIQPTITTDTNKKSQSSPRPPSEKYANIKFRNPMTPDHLNVDWYYKDSDGSKMGPVPFSELRELKHKGTIGDKTMILGDGLSDWTILQEDPELVMYL